MITLRALTVWGSLTFTPADPPRPHGRYTYQNTRPGLGNVTSDPTRRLQLRATVTGANPRTAPQQAHRARFAAAITAWHDLTPEARALWTEPAARRALSPYHAFISHYLLTH